MKQLPDAFVGHILSEATLQEADLLASAIQFFGSIAEQCEIGVETDTIVEEFELLGKYDVSYVCGFRFKDDDPDENGQTSLERAGFLWSEDVFDLLSEIAPKGTYFGASEGDGALFGFWAFCENCGMQTDTPTEMCEFCKERGSENVLR